MKQQCLNSFFGVSERAGGSVSKEEIEWPENESVLVGVYKHAELKSQRGFAQRRVAAFDLDGTLICPKSGKRWPTHCLDWKWRFGGADGHLVRQKMKCCIDSGQFICVISNQKWTGKVAADEHKQELQTKMQDICTKLNLPLMIIMATKDDINRKPRIGTLSIIEQFIQGPLDEKNNLYVGDAAGRKGDHADTDLKFALNAKWDFFVPEAFFLGRTNVYPQAFVFDPREQRAKQTLNDIADELVKSLLHGPLAIIVIGCPGSGKSFFSRRLKDSHGFVVINQDTLKTKDRVDKTWKESLTNKRSVVLDRQNYQQKSRSDYTLMAKEAGYECLAVYFDVSKQMAHHGNVFRMLSPSVSEHRPEVVPSMVLSTYYKYLEPPTTEEGFSRVITINEDSFCPGPFENDQSRILFHSFLS